MAWRTGKIIDDVNGMAEFEGATYKIIDWDKYPDKKLNVNSHIKNGHGFVYTYEVYYPLQIKLLKSKSGKLKIGVLSVIDGKTNEYT